MKATSRCPACGFKKLSSDPSTVTLNGKKFSLFKDYLHRSGKASSLEKLPYDQKVKYLEKRAKLILLNPLEELAHLEKSSMTNKYHLLNIVTLVCCGIEALGHYLLPDQKIQGNKKKRTENREYFKIFVSQFMSGKLQRVCKHTQKTYSHYIWKYFRNGLAHGFCVERGGIERKRPFFTYYQKKDRLIVDVDLLFEDFKQAFGKFFEKLESEGSNGTYGKTFEDRFKKLILNP
jgi:hypothetical protein